MPKYCTQQWSLLHSSENFSYEALGNIQSIKNHWQTIRIGFWVGCRHQIPQTIKSYWNLILRFTPIWLLPTTPMVSYQHQCCVKGHLSYWQYPLRCWPVCCLVTVWYCTVLSETSFELEPLHAITSHTRSSWGDT